MPTVREFTPPVPIVGQTFAVHEGVAMASFTCRCRPDNAPMLIPHVDVVKACSHCRHAYVITAIVFDRRQGHRAPIVTVKDVGAQPMPQEIPQP